MVWDSPPTEMDLDIVGRRRVRLDVPYLSQRSLLWTLSRLCIL